jgi:hypothetical protein
VSVSGIQLAILTLSSRRHLRGFTRPLLAGCPLLRHCRRLLQAHRALSCHGQWQPRPAAVVVLLVVNITMARLRVHRPLSPFGVAFASSESAFHHSGPAAIPPEQQHRFRMTDNLVLSRTLSSFLVGLLLLVILHSLSFLHRHRQNNRYTQFQILNRTHFTLKRQAIIITSMQLTGIYLCTTAISSHIHTYFCTPHQLTASSYMFNYLHTIRPICLSYFFLNSLRAPLLDSDCVYLFYWSYFSLLVCRVPSHSTIYPSQFSSTPHFLQILPLHRSSFPLFYSSLLGTCSMFT